ncbi:MAG: threonine synthase [Oscillospiraceae bacterium]|nr:threonine synthase [Oscillospiraceae bacterium]
MHYISTRDNTLKRTAAQAIAQGLADDGGLFLPSQLPNFTPEHWQTFAQMTYAQRAANIMALFLPEFSCEELEILCAKAYSNFNDPAVAKVVTVGDDCLLELWHGPTHAFKDMALQALPHLLTASLRKTGETRTACILVATSGDTGIAAMNGFRDVDGTKAMVFYPQDGVSAVQQLQMTTQEGENLGVCAVKGNFDDAQSGIKTIFADKELQAQLSAQNCFFSSANSINWGRVLPQIVYYISAYVDMVEQDKLKIGETFNICVPTGNFGNILAAYYAKQLGAPIGKLLCASNQNDVLTDFINSGTYDKRRDFYTTVSPSMDILISSNLERALYALSNNDSKAVKNWMAQLKTNGHYTVNDDVKAKLQEQFYAAACDEATTKATIADIWARYQYLLDPHTAVGYNVAQGYKAEAGDNAPMLIVSTASPFKFAGAVLSALGEGTDGNHEQALAALTGWQVPESIAKLADKKIRFTECVAVNEMRGVVERFAAM